MISSSHIRTSTGRRPSCSAAMIASSRQAPESFPALKETTMRSSPLYRPVSRSSAASKVGMDSEVLPMIVEPLLAHPFHVFMLVLDRPPQIVFLVDPGEAVGTLLRPGAWPERPGSPSANAHRAPSGDLPPWSSMRLRQQQV